MDTLLSTRQQTLATLQHKLAKAQATMKHYADKHRRDLTFNVGDWVYVKLRPYKQTSTKDSPNTKLSKRFYGPYQIVKRCGEILFPRKQQFSRGDSSKVDAGF